MGDSDLAYVEAYSTGTRTDEGRVSDFADGDGHLQASGVGAGLVSSESPRVDRGRAGGSDLDSSTTGSLSFPVMSRVNTSINYHTLSGEDFDPMVAEYALRIKDEHLLRDDAVLSGQRISSAIAIIRLAYDDATTDVPEAFETPDDIRSRPRMLPEDVASRLGRALQKRIEEWTATAMAVARAPNAAAREAAQEEAQRHEDEVRLPVWRERRGGGLGDVGDTFGASKGASIHTLAYTRLLSYTRLHTYACIHTNAFYNDTSNPHAHERTHAYFALRWPSTCLPARRSTLGPRLCSRSLRWSARPRTRR